MAFDILTALKSAFLPSGNGGSSIGTGGTTQTTPVSPQTGQAVPQQLQLTDPEKRALALMGGQGGGGGQQSGQGASNMAMSYANAGYQPPQAPKADTSMFVQNTWSPPQLSTLGRGR